MAQEKTKLRVVTYEELLRDVLKLYRTGGVKSKGNKKQKK